MMVDLARFVGRSDLQSMFAVKCDGSMADNKEDAMWGCCTLTPVSFINGCAEKDKGVRSGLELPCICIFISSVNTEEGSLLCFRDIKAVMNIYSVCIGADVTRKALFTWFPV